MGSPNNTCCFLFLQLLHTFISSIHSTRPSHSAPAPYILLTPEGTTKGATELTGLGAEEAHSTEGEGSLGKAAAASELLEAASGRPTLDSIIKSRGI